jgi:hypothetical protein
MKPLGMKAIWVRLAGFGIAKRVTHMGSGSTPAATVVKIISVDAIRGTVILDRTWSLLLAARRDWPRSFKQTN